MHPGYFLAAALVAIEAGILAWAASPDVDPAYRAVYIDHTANCYPVEVSGEYELGSTVSFAQYGSSRFRDTITRCGWPALPNRRWSISCSTRSTGRRWPGRT